MKALGVLNHVKLMFAVDDPSRMTIDNAITELEALQEELSCYKQYPLSEPKTCHSCVFNEDSYCMHCDVPDGDTIEYIKFSGCGLHQPKEPQ
jgi:hypothetical protein